MHYLRPAVPLLFIYLMISSNLELSNIVIGLLLAFGVSALLRPPREPIPWRAVPAALFALLQYMVILIVDLIGSGIQVARIVLTPALPLNQGIIAIPSLFQTELGTALSAHAITVTPGEMVIEIDDDGTMYTHCLDATKAEAYVNRAQRQRRELLTRIFI